MPDDSLPHVAETLARLVAKSRAAGADAADAFATDTVSLSAASRFGAVERVGRAETGKLALRVFVGRRQAIAASADRSPRALDDLVERVVAMARVVPEDPFCGLADPADLAGGWPDLDLNDPVDLSPETLADRARALETAALAVPGVVNSRTVEAGWSRTAVTMAASNGFAGSYEATRHWLFAHMLASDGTAMERDYEGDTKLHATDLRDPAEVGRAAGERVARRLGGRKVPSRRVPVVFEARVASSLLDHLAGAVNGQSIARRTSFLQDRFGERIFPETVTITDDPFLRRGLRSRPFDADGVAGAPRAVVEKGRLASWLLDLRSARQLGLATTGHATRSGPAPANLRLEPGTRSPADLIADIDEGFFVTELMGFGVNGVTGDYSRGAAGFWIEKGEIAYPVNEITIAGNLKDMFRSLEPANDLDLRHGVDSPTLRVEGMMVAGT